MITSENTDIFIAAHTDFNNCPNDNIYKIITTKGALKNTYPIDIIEEDEKSIVLSRRNLYGDISRLLYIADNVKLKEYIGFCHYRRYFNVEHILDNNIFNDKSIIVPNLIPTPGFYTQYNECHIIENLNDALDIFINKFPNLNKALDIQVSNQKAIYPHNMFIMPVNLFYELINIYKQVFFELDKIYKFETDEDVDKYLISKNIIDIDNQHKIYSYIGERITSIYIISLILNNYNVYIDNIKILDK